MPSFLKSWGIAGVSFCMLFITLGPLELGAQSESVVSGTVVDQAGKAIPGAAVTVRTADSIARTLATDAQGSFAVSGLAAGAYIVEVTSPGFAASRRGIEVKAGVSQDLPISLSISGLAQTVTVEATASIAAQLAPSGNTLDAISARTEITGQFIKYFASPLADFNEVVQMAPGTFSVNSNGVGLGQGKTYFRGFKDTQYTITYDGIPFQDTNDPSHHSWAFFPGQWIGSTDFDRSPGIASSVGPTNFGGSIHLLSQDLQSSPNIQASASYGSFNTRIFDLSLDSGQFRSEERRVGKECRSRW